MIIRPFKTIDLPVLHSINEAGVPGVGAEQIEDLAHWIRLSDTLVAVDEADTALGFLTLLKPGTAAYPSANLRWFEARGDDFIYVDRIAIAETARGQRMGEALYRAAFRKYAGKVSVICCEVNSLPPNPGSMRFHDRLGFAEIGRQTYVDGEKAVVFLERPLSDQ